VSEAIRFADASVEARGEFLEAARDRYPTLNVTGAWYCDSCGAHFALEDVLMLDGETKCPTCEMSGWPTVFPLDQA
jgi:rubrerythrin